MSAELDGALNEQEQEALRAHLDRCEDCRRLRAAMASIDESVAGLEEPAPAGLKQGVMYRIEQEASGKKTAKRRFFGRGSAIGIVAAALVLLIGTGLIRIPAANRSGDVDFAPEYSNEEGTRSTRLSTASIPGYFFNAPSEAADQSGAEDVKQLNPDSALIPNAPPETILLDPPDDGPEPVASESPRATPGGQPVTEQLRYRCGKLAGDTKSPVLLYSEFTYDSLLKLLSVYAPELAECLEDCTVVQEGGLVRCETDWQTLMAVQEWILAMAPRSAGSGTESEGRIREQMEALDPDSEYLYRVVTFEGRRPEPLPADSWPADWPAQWAERLLDQENWALFLPTEDASPRATDAAWLVFPAVD